MEPIPKSGLFYPNKISRIALLALEDVMGKNGVNAILNLASLPHLIGNYPPTDLNREFDFADFSAINGALEEMYGPRGGRGLALRAGRATFDEGLRLDVLVENTVICELKAVETMQPIFAAQLLTYLKLTGKRLGFLINFNTPLIKQGIKRMVL